MKNEYPVYGRHDSKCRMRYADGKPIEELISIFNTESEAIIFARNLLGAGWYDIRIVAHVGYGSPKELADMYRKTVNI